MQHTLSPTPPVHLQSRLRRLTFLALGLCVAALLAALATVVAHASSVSVGGLFAPTVADGVIPEGTVVTLGDDDVPAIAGLDPELREALRRAEADAAAEGLFFEVTSGWRTPEYQQWLLEDAIELYASEQVARRFVATPDRSSHVTGDAVDIVPVDAQFWLIEHGSRYGICQAYANERWHFELATQPGGVCPEMKADAGS